MRFIIVHDLKLLLRLSGPSSPRVTSSSARPRPHLPAGALLVGGPLLGLLMLSGGLLCGHSERSDCGEEVCGRELDRDGALTRFKGRLNTELSLQIMRETGQAGKSWLLLVALALALVAEELASPHAQKALGAGVRAHSERCVGRGPGRQRVAVGAGQGGLQQQG